jgi:hypothetical protein
MADGRKATSHTRKTILFDVKRQSIHSSVFLNFLTMNKRNPATNAMEALLLSLEEAPQTRRVGGKDDSKVREAIPDHSDFPSLEWLFQDYTTEGSTLDLLTLVTISRSDSALVRCCAVRNNLARAFDSHISMSPKKKDVWIPSSEGRLCQAFDMNAAHQRILPAYSHAA